MLRRVAAAAAVAADDENVDDGDIATIEFESQGERTLRQIKMKHRKIQRIHPDV